MRIARHAAVHCLNVPSTFAIAAPHAVAVRDIPPSKATISPFGMLGSRCSQRRRPTNNPTPASTGQSVDKPALEICHLMCHWLFGVQTMHDDLAVFRFLDWE
jgi:hypothetical protein